MSLNATDKILWSALITASLNDHKLSLETNADFSKISPGHYLLRVESGTGIEINAPVFLGDRPAIQSKSIRSRISGILLDAALIGRNWLSDGYRRGVSEQSTDADKLLLDGDRYAWLGNWAAAGPLYMRAEALFRQRFDVRGEIHARVGRIRASAESMPFVQVSSMLGEELENSVVQNDARLKLFCLTAKGYTDLDVDPPSSRKDWEQARVLAKSLGERAQEGRAIGELGILSFLEGDGATAKKLVGSAFLIAVMMGDVGGQVRYLSMFGNGLNALQRYDEALEYFNRALSVAEHTPDIGFPFMAYEGKADALIALRNSGDAESLLNHALVEARRLGRRGHESQLYIVLGRMARARGAKEAAVKYLESAADLARNAQFYRMVADAMFELASLYRAENKLDLAEASLQQGIVASRKISDRFYLPRDLSALAEIKELQGDPEAAQALYEQATDVLDGLLVKSASPSAKRSIVAAMSDIYVRQFALAVRMGNRSKAFAILERARGRSTADFLRTSAHRATEAPNETPADREITNLQLRLLHSTSITERKQILADLFDTEQKRNLELGAQTRPSPTHRIRLSELRRLLRSDELLLEYVVSDAGSYCLAVSRSHSAVIRLTKGRRALEGAVRSYLTAVQGKKEVAAEARQLYSILFQTIPEIRSKLRLIVVPDGPLNLLPFDSLRDQDDRYALYSHIISYAPSATVLCALRTAHRKRRALLPFLGVGDVAYTSNLELTAQNTNPSHPTEIARGVYDLAGAHFAELPGTRQEIMELGRIFGSKSILLMGSGASEAAFKAQKLSQFRVIHLAVHSVAAPKYPERSALVLGSDPQNREDGLLQAREITALPLNAELVTLSACDTGTGKLEGEEGTDSLERSFLIAGARTVVATLWGANDIFTPALIKAFYMHLSNHEDKGAALRNAKLDVLRQFGQGLHPFYWAGFMMDGDSASRVSSSIQ